MGIISIDLKSGDIRTPRRVAQDVDPLTGKGRSYSTRWVKTGSALQKSPVRTGYRYHPDRYPERKQTRVLKKPREGLTRTILSRKKDD
tara:strand:- start:259 stop:522 length:264 start_codon:yes stop_codon:yes gene_type:complete